MIRLVAILLVATGCARPLPPNVGLGRNAAGKEAWKARLESATFASSTATLVFGVPARATLVIPTCYAHAQSKIGDHDNFSVQTPDHGNANAGSLDIDDCTTAHVKAKLSVTFADGAHVEATIDTELKP